MKNYANSGYKTINLRIKIYDQSNLKRLIKHIKMCDAFCNQESYILHPMRWSTKSSQFLTLTCLSTTFGLKLLIRPLLAVLPAPPGNLGKTPSLASLESRRDRRRLCLEHGTPVYAWAAWWHLGLNWLCLLRYESSTLILFKEPSSSIFQSLWVSEWVSQSVRHR